MIQQISVFVENKPGRLYSLTKVLGDAKIDLVMLTIADTEEFGIVRFITKKNEEALATLKENGFTATITSLIGIEVSDRPNGLAEVLKIMTDNEMSVEYLYSFARTEKENAIILFRVDDVQKTVETLAKYGIKTVENIL